MIPCDMRWQIPARVKERTSAWDTSDGKANLSIGFRQEVE